MPSTPTKTTGQSDAQRRARLERSIQATAKKLDGHRKSAKELQDQLDQMVLEAKGLNVRYRTIADLTGRSVAWVQAALIRAGHVPDKDKTKKTKGERAA